MSSRRLLHVTTVSQTLSAFLLPFADYFRGKGWTVEAAASGVHTDERCVASFDAVHHIPWSRNPFSPTNIAATRAIQRLVHTRKFDIVHVHTPVAAFLGRFALRNYQAGRVVYTAHGFHFHPGGSTIRNAVYIALEKLASPWTDALITMNNWDAAAARFLGLPANGLHFESPGIGVDSGRFSKGAIDQRQLTTLRQQLGLRDEDVLFLMIAEFIPRKRHRDVLGALAVSRDPRIHVAFAGSGPLLKEMQALSRRLGVEAQCHFLGHRRDIPELLAASRALLLVSDQEGLPRSVLEALCMGIPVIGSRIRGVTDLLANGAGLLVDVGDVEGLSRAMSIYASDRTAAERAGEAGSALVRGSCLTTHVLKLYERIYDQVLAR